MKEFKGQPRPKMVTIGEARERDALIEKNNIEIAKYAQMAEKVRELKVRDFEPRTPIIMEEIAGKLDQGSFIEAKLLAYRYINELSREDSRDLQKALGLIDEKGKLTT